MIRPSTGRSARLRRRGAAASLAALLILTGVACGDDTEDTADETAEPTASDSSSESTAADTATETGDGEEIVVTAEDYKFVGLPATTKVGTKLTLTNNSPTELHELVAVKIPESETRSIDELVKLPEAELDALFGAAQPAMVLVHPPGGGDMIPAVGDGTFTEAGRYIIICAIPVGADPAKMMAAMQAATEGPPTTEPGAGPPHFTQGMYAGITVEE